MTPARKIPVITVMSDFGHNDGYVAEMKGAILSRIQCVQLVDITHEIPAFDIETGARMLAQTFSRFPLGTVHLAVVDPGVGGGRKCLVVYNHGHYFIGPDNGLFTLIAHPLKKAQIFSIKKISGPGISATFHGRDVFAPAAAGVASGMSPLEFAIPIKTLITLKNLEPLRTGTHKWLGKIIKIDHFGNAISNFPARLLNKMNKPVLLIKDKKIIHRYRTFVDGAPGKPGMIINSDQLVEIILPGESAGKTLDIVKGEPVILLDILKNKEECIGGG
ncbi:SAM-dependent chlorinase/fluorinase [bacterium]|nr:SAM-dependent chlorinase/fluorinase [bacterium]